MAAQAPGAQQRPESAGALLNHAQENLISRLKPAPPPINTGAGYPTRLTPINTKSSSSFVTPTDLAQNSSGFTGKRPAGSRMAGEPTNLTAGPETHKGKRGLPFLKNPMSTLLMRRKPTQPPPDPRPPPNPIEPTYDPRIRGTRVHDFSAPRAKRFISSPEVNATSPTVVPPSSDPARPQSVGENGESFTGAQHPPVFDPRIAANVEKQEPGTENALGPIPAEAELFSVRRPERPPPPVPEKDASTGSVHTVHTSSSTTSRAYSVETSTLARTTSSRRTATSNNPALSRTSTKASVMSSVPKHMKSTSSRFSFDMIGSANQEKILEERHRQREQEKKTTDDSFHPRDSTYDEFDADEFDYDAMMDDDGLEERIPGVNADLEDMEDEYNYEAEVDPDDDQENFAGFVFERSNPTSSLASPHSPGMLATPRDANGKVIGFAMTKDTTPELPTSASPFYLQDMTFPTKQDDDQSGFGINELTINDEETLDGQLPLQLQLEPNSDYQASAYDASRPRTTPGDDIYFDDGLADELDFEHDGTVFDESIFDNVDTDKFGRPIPGAFARAHEAMRAGQKPQGSKRDSDEVTNSQFSAPSGPSISQSTAHTSLSVGLPQPPIVDESVSEPTASLPAEQPQVQKLDDAPILEQDLLYQAALAAAAQQAEASGKFRRSSSPPLPAELTITSPTDSSESLQASNLDGAMDDYDADDYNADDYNADDYNADDYEADEPYSTYIDDDDFDDDVIAEANASALANDSDGWYGQEFGFYSVPLQQPHHHGHGHQNPAASSTSIAPPNNIPLSAENLFQYANGGYFGPAGQGVFRSQSGRVVSREPNLTPITERSEYSNRNSVMSLALPPAIGSEGGGGRSSSAGMPSSPGLAQLALLASSEDDTMSLSALMRLRSKAWGGSQASGVSSREGSPRSERAGGLPPSGGEGPTSPFGGGMFGSGLQQYQHTRKNSNFSLWSTNSDAGVGSQAVQAGESGPGSPTLTVVMPQPQAHAQVPFGMAGLGSPLASSPLPPPDMVSPGLQQQYQPQQLYIPPPMPSMPSPGQLGASNNACSPVLESEEAGYNDQNQSYSSGQGVISPVHLSSPNPLYPQWTNTPVQAQAARLAMMSNGNSPNNIRPGVSAPVLQIGEAGVGGGGGRSGPPSPMLVRRPASASGSASASGFASGSGMGHRHKGSADSISYVREEEIPGVDGENDGRGSIDGGSLSKRGSGGTRWVMERRRTDESTGEVEILEREVIEGGTI